MTGILHDPVALGLAVLAVLIVVIGIGVVALALGAAAAYGDQIAENAHRDPHTAAALDEFGDETDAVVFDFPTDPTDRPAA